MIQPAAEDLNRVPSSRELASPVTSVVAGTAEALHRVQGQVTAGGVELVWKVHVTGAVIALPHRSEACTDAV